MKLHTKLEYLNLLEENASRLEPSPETVSAVLDQAVSVWKSCGLKPRKLRPADLVASYQHGDAVLHHVKVFARKEPDTHVVLVADESDNFTGHILIDLAAEYSSPFLHCPACDYDDHVAEEELASLIEGIDPGDDNPFAILMTGDGTFIQTYRESAEEFLVEYQLVNTSSHYELLEAVPQATVIKLFHSFAFGNNEWLQMPWEKQEL